MAGETCGLARMSHQLRDEAKKSAVDSRCSDRKQPEAYLRYGEDCWRENAANLLCFRPPQQVAGEKSGLARISHQLRREAKKSAVDSRTSDQRPPEVYLTYSEDGRREKAAKMRCFSKPQQMAGEKCGLGMAPWLRSGRFTLRTTP